MSTDEELTEKYQTMATEGPLAELFTVQSVKRVNHKPHPFMVGSRAVVIASDRYDGLLGTDGVGVGVCTDVGAAVTGSSSEQPSRGVTSRARVRTVPATRRLISPSWPPCARRSSGR